MAFVSETNVPPKANICIKGYKWFQHNSDEVKMNRVGVYIKNSRVKQTFIDIDSDVKLWIRICLPQNQIVLGTVYGVQETAPMAVATEQFQKLKEEIMDYQNKNLSVLLIGDFNAKIGNDQFGISGNNQFISRNGRLFRNLIDETNTIILNSSSKCSGLWTRVNTKNPLERSILDYAIVSQNLSDSILSMTIDDQQLYKIKGTCPTDHNTILLDILCEKVKSKSLNITGWKINESTNWSDFSNNLSFYSTKQVLQSEASLTNIYDTWVKEVTEAASKTIGTFSMNPSRTDPLLRTPSILLARSNKRAARKNYSISIKSKNQSNIKSALQEYHKSQENLRRLLDEQKAKIQENQLDSIIKTGGTRSKKFWTFVRQSKRPNSEDLLAVKKEDGTRLFSEADIKEYTSSYFTDLYSPTTSQLFSPQWTKLIEDEVKFFHSIETMNSHPMNSPITHEEIAKASAASSLGKSGGPSTVKYEFMKYGGDPMVNSLHSIFNKVFQSESCPEQWLHSHIINLGKGKGDREKLSSKRGITLSECPAKIFEKVLFSRIIKHLPFSEAQAGGRQERGCVDQLFVLKSVLNQRKQSGYPCFIAFLDIEKAFDKTWTEALLYNLWDKGIRGKIWRVIANLHTNLTAKVQTKFGLTESIKITGGVRQGGILSAPEFSSFMDRAVKDLQDLGLGIHYSDTILLTILLLMDDVTLTAETPPELQILLPTQTLYRLKVGKFAVKY